MRTIILIAVGLLGACQESSTAIQTRTCAPFDKVATERLSSRWENWDGEDVAAYWREWLRRDVVAGAVEPAAVLTLSIRPYPTVEQFTFDIRGQRIDGMWRMERRKSAGREEPEGPWQSFALSERGARGLDGLLADDCLWVSPRFLSSQVPMRSGPTQTYYHAPLTFFEVRQGEREWGGAHELMAGAPGQLVALLLFAAYPERGQFDEVVEDFDQQTGDGGSPEPA